MSDIVVRHEWSDATYTVYITAWRRIMLCKITIIPAILQVNAEKFENRITIEPDNNCKATAKDTNVGTFFNVPTFVLGIH